MKMDRHAYYRNMLSQMTFVYQLQVPAATAVEEEEESDTPPALPSQPPPAPNWSTFPGAAPAPATDFSFLDQTDLVPDAAVSVPNDNHDFQFCGMEQSELDEATRTKISMLKRRADFLGVNLNDMEEYRKLQEGKEKN